MSGTSVRWVLSACDRKSGRSLQTVYFPASVGDSMSAVFSKAEGIYKASGLRDFYVVGNRVDLGRRY